jgi:alcohol dehydrogenase class IV
VVTVLESLDEHKIRYSIFDRARVEPTDESFCEAISAAQADSFDAFVAAGGGSTIDTPKAANLYSCYPADFLYLSRFPGCRNAEHNEQVLGCFLLAAGQMHRCRALWTGASFNPLSIEMLDSA